MTTDYHAPDPYMAPISDESTVPIPLSVLNTLYLMAFAHYHEHYAGRCYTDPANEAVTVRLKYVLDRVQAAINAHDDCVVDRVAADLAGQHGSEQCRPGVEVVLGQ